MTEQRRDELAEAIGRVAVAASMADLTVRTVVGQLGGPGASILAEAQDSTSTLIDWCKKFVEKLHTPDETTADRHRARSEALKATLVKRNIVVHGLWFADDEGQSVARRQRGKPVYNREQYSLSDVNELAQAIRNAAYDFAEIGQTIAWPDWPGLGSREGRDVH